MWNDVFEKEWEKRPGVLFAHSGNLGYEVCIHVANSLPELCRGTNEIG
ncbi:hypothetical protein ABIC22_003353 [Paenibacillus sp. PvP094]